MNWVTGLLQHALDSGCTRIEARPDAEEAWVAEVQRFHERMLFRRSKGWFTGYNSNVEGHQEGTVRYQAYFGCCRQTAADPRHLALLEGAQELAPGAQAACRRSRRGRACRRSASSNLPGRAWTPVATPPSMPNSSLSRSDSGSAAQLRAMSAPFAAREEVEELRHQLLAGAALAAHQDVHAAGRHPLHQLEHPPHGRRLGDDAAAATSWPGSP